MNSTGFYKLPRSIMNDPIWSKEIFSKREAYIDLLLLANYAPGDFILKEQLCHLERGQLIRSLSALAERWHWSVKAVRTYLAVLERAEKIKKTGTPQGTVITLENYDMEVFQGQAYGQIEGTLEAQEGQRNDKNKQEIINNFINDYVSDYSKAIQEAIINWVTYKADRGEAYGEKDLKCWMDNLDSKCALYEEKHIVKAINNSMGNQYKNIFWDYLQSFPRKQKEAIPKETHEPLPPELQKEYIQKFKDLVNGKSVSNQ